MLKNLCTGNQIIRSHVIRFSSAFSKSSNSPNFSICPHTSRLVGVHLHFRSVVIEVELSITTNPAYPTHPPVGHGSVDHPRDALFRLLQRAVHLGLLSSTVLALGLLYIRILDGQAPDVDIITDGRDHVKLERCQTKIPCHSQQGNEDGNLPQSCRKCQSPGRGTQTQMPPAQPHCRARG